MPKLPLASFLAPLALPLLSSSAWAQDPPPAPPPPAAPAAMPAPPPPAPVPAPTVEDRKINPGANSINLNPLGVFFGSYSLNYERLFDHTHGLLIEPGFSYNKDDDSSSKSFGLDLGYRWHWSNEQDSGFLGANVSGYWGTGDAKVSTLSGTRSFDVSVRSISVVANVGRRFAWRNGFNITLRIGGGYANRKVSTSSTDPDAQKAVKLVDDLISLFPIAIDSEASIGYIF